MTIGAAENSKSSLPACPQVLEDPIAAPISLLAQSTINHSYLTTNVLPLQEFCPELTQWCEDKRGDSEYESRVVAAQRITEASQKQTKNLNLSHLGLSSLPDYLGTLTHLETLHLNGNRLRGIQPLSALKELRTLLLFNNLIENIGALAGLSKLKRLYLGGNRIIDISPLSELYELQTLSLCGNKIKDIKAISGLSKLLSLDLSKTAIQEIPPELAQLAKESTVTALDTPLSLDEIRAFEERIQKTRSENPNLGPQFIFHVFSDDLIPANNMIPAERPSPVIGRSTHETSNYLGSKISVLLGKLGATPLDIDVNFLSLDPHHLIEEVHRGIKFIRESSKRGISTPASLLKIAEKNEHLFPTIAKIRQIAEEAMTKCQGLALSGGPDIEPEFYDGASELLPSDYRRSIGEFALAFAATKQRKPILGTCRGAQMINVLFGGTLKTIARQMDWQTIELTESSKKQKLEQLLQSNSLPAYFFHHQACDQIAPNFEVVMHRDGIPAMILSQDDMVMGVQVHPEQDENEKYSKIIRIYRLFLKKSANF